VGGFLVAVAAVVVFAAALAAAGGDTRSYVVAAHALPAGTVIGPGDTTTARMGLNTANRASAFTDAGRLVGRGLTIAVQPGELIESSMVATPAGANRRPVSIPVDASSLAALAAGESVDVLSTSSASGASASGASASGASGSGASGSGASNASAGITVVMRGATLWSVERAGGGLLSPATGSTVVVTLGVSDLAEAEQLVNAAHTGTVELVQATPDDGAGLGPG
jgi:SAF domain